MVAQNGVNFALYVANGTGVRLCLFTEEDLQEGRTSLEVPLDPVINRTGDIWHLSLPNLDTTLLYGASVRYDVGVAGQCG